jgi:hypothetical protein
VAQERAVTSRAARDLALAAAAAFAACVLATLAFVVLAGASSDDLIVIAFGGYAAVGTLIALRQPRNAVGWLLLAIGLAFAFGAATEAYLSSDLAGPRQWIGWLSSASTPLWLVLAGVVLPLVFPDGRLLGPHWRWALVLGGAALGCALLGTQLAPGPLDLDTEGIENPLGLGGLAGEVAEAGSQVGLMLLVPAVALSASSLVLRFRRSRGAERQQLKWFAFVGALALASLLLSAILGALGERENPPAWVDAIGAVSWFSSLGLFMFGLPAATGIAILRHRLYDIDLVIRRTLVYGALTASLAGVYLGLVLLAGLAIGDSDIAVAAATLAVAALFRPARARIQEMVDRRFYRRRYDAARTLEEFGARLRDELDLEALAAELRGAVQDTVQPAHGSLWLRGPR